MSAKDMDAAIKAAEQRGYSRGYFAGLRRKDLDTSGERIQVQRQAFIDQAFLAALPACIEAQGWARGETKISSLEDRVRLAADFAREALRRRPFA